MIKRISGFFLLVGFICVAIYFITEPESGGFGLLTAGVALMTLGIAIWSKNREKPEESTRFVSLRKMNQRSKNERDKRLAKRKEKEKQKKGH